MVNFLLGQNFSQLSLSEQVNALFVTAPLLREKIVKHCDLGGRSPEQGLLEVLRFMSLINAKQTITPSERVDQIWHQFILWTKLYFEYCDTLYGRYLHHTPDDDGQKNKAQFEHCLNEYAKRFGEPDPVFWGPHWTVSLEGACSGCES